MGTSGGVVFLADFEAGEHFVIGHGGVQEAVINHFGKVIKGDVKVCWTRHCLVYSGSGVGNERGRRRVVV